MWLGAVSILLSPVITYDLALGVSMDVYYSKNSA
jgi:hypothetical protein